MRHPRVATGLITGEVDRVALSHGFFRIHQESDPESGSENAAFIVPADIPAEARSNVQETAKVSTEPWDARDSPGWTRS